MHTEDTRAEDAARVTGEGRRHRKSVFEPGPSRKAPRWQRTVEKLGPPSDGIAWGAAC